MKKLCEDMAMSMYREGRLDREIAEAIGYSRVSVTNWRKSRGLPPNRRRRPEKMLDAYKAAMPLERVQELSQAEKDGRLVVLPCKVGDRVYRVITTRDAAPVITEIEIKTLGQAADLIGRIGEKQLLVSWYLTREEAEAALPMEDCGKAWTPYRCPPEGTTNEA